MLFVEACLKAEALTLGSLRMKEHLAIARGALGKVARYCIDAGRGRPDRRAAVGMVPADDRNRGEEAKLAESLVDIGFAPTASRAKGRVPS